ncbi:MAG: helix-turn-helix domain-containing protein [Crocinitomicaceae bacterium]
MKNTLTFEDLPKAVSTLLERTRALQEELQLIKTNFEPKKPIEFLTRIETSTMLHVSLVTLHQWVKLGILTSYSIGNRVYFKRSEIEKAMIPSRKN